MQRLAQVKTHLESEIYKLSSEIRILTENQIQLNKEQNERITSASKTVINVRSDVNIEMEKMKSSMDVFEDKIEGTNLELIKSMDILNTMMELEYLSQILEF